MKYKCARCGKESAAHHMKPGVGHAEPWVCKSEDACEKRVRQAQFGQLDVELRFDTVHGTVWEQYTGHRVGIDGLVAVNRPGALYDSEGNTHNLKRHWQLIHVKSGAYMSSAYKKEELYDLAERLSALGDWVEWPAPEKIEAAAYVVGKWTTDLAYDYAERALAVAA